MFGGVFADVFGDHHVVKGVGLLLGRLGWEFTDEGPGDFDGLAVVVVDEKTVMEIGIEFNRFNKGRGQDKKMDK